MGDNKKYSVFLVDDDDFFLEMLYASLLDFPDVKFYPYKSGEKCIENLDKKPEIIILDQDFGKAGKDAMSGMQALKKIKELLPDTEVVMLTGQEDGEMVFEFIQAGARDYVIKDDDAFDNIEDVLKDIIIDL